MDWTEGPFSVGWKGTGRGQLGIMLQIGTPHRQSHFLRRALHFHSRMRKSRGAPWGPDWTSVCLDKLPAPHKHEGGRWASAGLSANSDRLLFKTKACF